MINSCLRRGGIIIIVSKFVVKMSSCIVQMQLAKWLAALKGVADKQRLSGRVTRCTRSAFLRSWVRLVEVCSSFLGYTEHFVESCALICCEYIEVLRFELAGEPS